MRKLIEVGAAVLVLAAAGCGGKDEQAANVVEVRGDEYAYVVPGTIEGGVVTMRFTNTGKELHEYALGKLAARTTLAELRRAIAAQDEGGFQKLLSDVGGVPALSPGEEIAITRELEPGTYALLCFLPSPEGTPHVVKGMLASFEVEGRGEAVLPKTDAVIVARDKAFDVSGVAAERQTIELRNGASSPRGFYLIAPKPGKSIDDVGRWGDGGFKGPAPARMLGAMQSIPPKSSVFVELELDKGARYLLFDEEAGETEFTVE